MYISRTTQQVNKRSEHNLILIGVPSWLQLFPSDLCHHAQKKLWSPCHAFSLSQSTLCLVLRKITACVIVSVSCKSQKHVQLSFLSLNINIKLFYSFSSVTQSRPTLWDPMNPSMPGLPVHHQLPEITQIHVHQVVMPSSHLILCLPVLFLPPIPRSIRVFYNESTLHMRWPKYWSFSFSISPSNEHPGWISFRMDWLDLAVQGTLKSLLQHHSSKASILQRSTFFTVQLSHPYMTTRETFKGQLFLFHQNLNWVSHEFWSLPTQLLALWQKTTSHEYLYLIFGKFHRFNP